jgi:molybdate/tungstate transport system substrate-binding protein
MSFFKRILTISILAVFVSCNPSGKTNSTATLHVIHAGSLTKPVHEIADAFKAENPGVEILTEAWGSKAGARRVIDINTPADVFLSADYMVIENMLIPDHASWYIPFATNELAIVYTPESRYAELINAQNWHEILLKPDVKFGRSNPDMDPCGVRSVFTIQLAESLKNEPGLAEDLLMKDTDNIRPKETDLIALLESHHIDYIFLYKSVAVQHGLEYLQLPDSLSLGNFELNDWYGRASIQTLGTEPGETITEYGEAMVYGLTIPHKAEETEWAEKFVAFVLNPEKGQSILSRLGQEPVGLFSNPYSAKVPQNLK